MANKREFEGARLEGMDFWMRDHAKDGALVGQEAGAAARSDLEAKAVGAPPGLPIAVRFRDVTAITVPFAEAFFVPLLAGRMVSGYFDEHPLVVTEASEDVSQTISAALRLRNLSVFGIGDETASLLGGDDDLAETMRVAHALGEFSVAQLARKMGLSQQTANNRITRLFKRGTLTREVVVPNRGGREFRYRVPSVEGAGDQANTASEPGRKSTTRG